LLVVTITYVMVHGKFGGLSMKYFHTAVLTICCLLLSNELFAGPNNKILEYMFGAVYSIINIYYENFGR